MDLETEVSCYVILYKILWNILAGGAQKKIDQWASSTHKLLLMYASNFFWFIQLPLKLSGLLLLELNIELRSAVEKLGLSISSQSKHTDTIYRIVVLYVIVNDAA